MIRRAPVGRLRRSAARALSEPSGDATSFDLLWSLSGDVLLEIDEGRRIVRAGGRALELLGHAPASLAGRDGLELVHPSDRPVAEAAFECARSGRSPRAVRYRWRHAEGSWVWMTATAAAIPASRDRHRGGPPRVLACLTPAKPPIEDSKAPADRSEMFEILAQNLPGVVYLSRHDHDYSKLYLNGAVEELTGYSPETLLWGSPPFAALFHPDDEAAIREGVASAIEQARPYRLEYRLRRADGSYRWVEDYGQPVRTVGGELAYLEGALFDITARRRGEAARRAAGRLLEVSEERFAKAFFANPNPAVITTLVDGTILEVNEVLCELSGLRREDLIGGDGSKLGLWDRNDARRMTRLLTERGSVRGVEIHAHSHDGVEYDLLLSSVVVEMSGEKCVINVGVDITEHKRLETQLLRAQRLESIGVLAGGIAHDLNNVLTPILMAIKLLRRGRPSQHERVLSILETNSRRGADLIRQLLTFARGADGQRIPVELRHLVQEVGDIARDTFPKSMKLSVRFDRDLWQVEGDPTQIQQVLLNLAVNARDAMEGEGRLRIAAHNRELTAEDLRTRPAARTGRYVLLEVADTGPGIPRELRHRVFDPFFTTKDPEHGTGLGLFTVETIVAAHGGFIEIDGGPAGGTLFSVYLPVARESDPEGSWRSILPSPRGDGELVLLADDDEAVREIAASVLEASGYRTVLAADGRAALRRFEERRAEVKAVVMDLRMPHLDGGAAIRALRELEPGLPIVAMSGDENAAPPPGADLVLSKPLTAEDLLDALRRVLRASAEGGEGAAEEPL